MAQAVCIEKGWQLVDLPADERVSGYSITDLDGNKAANFHKGNLGKFIEKVKRGEIPKGSCLILERLDRFSRNYFDIVFPVWLNLLQSGVEIFSCVSHTHYTLQSIRDNPMMAGMALMELANANDYSRNLGNRITKSFDIRLAQCQQGAKMQLGTWQPRWITFTGEHKQSGTFKVNEHAATLQRMVSEYLAGQSMYSIATGLIKDEIPTLAGGHWSQGSIGHLLGSETLIGTTTIKGVRLEHYYPAVISQKEYEQLQAKIRQNITKKGGSSRASDYIANLFRNRCKCSVCDGTITSQKSGNHHNYFCKGVRVGRCEQKKMLNIGAVERDFFLNYLQQSPNELLGKQTGEHSTKATAIQATLAKLDKDIGATTELIGVLDIGELKAKLTTLENKRQQAKAELDTLNTSMVSGMNAPKALADIRAVFLKKWNPKGTKEVDASLSWAFDVAPLKDNGTRKKLLELLPSIVKGLIIDLKGQRYLVVNHHGQQSDWRKV